ncbi:hypothetical protein KY312_02090 [Candidatus Woesearchaeota archaeon]|nr:hypothetical protein [Candidatus Woesearchaeota archaeon]
MSDGEPLLRSLKACKERLAKERNALEEILEEYNSILENTCNAHDDIENAINELSEYL